LVGCHLFVLVLVQKPAARRVHIKEKLGPPCAEYTFLRYTRVNVVCVLQRCLSNPKPLYLLTGLLLGFLCLYLDSIYTLAPKSSSFTWNSPGSPLRFVSTASLSFRSSSTCTSFDLHRHGIKWYLRAEDHHRWFWLHSSRRSSFNRLHSWSPGMLFFFFSSIDWLIILLKARNDKKIN
jgi:hypothetical protein